MNRLCTKSFFALLFFPSLLLSGCIKTNLSEEDSGEKPLQDYSENAIPLEKLTSITLRLPHVKTAPAGFSGKSLGLLAEPRAQQPNVVYVARSGDALGLTFKDAPKTCSTKNCPDLIFWNGDDRFTEATTSASSTDAGGLYIGAVRHSAATTTATTTILATANIEILRYIPPKLLSIPGKVIDTAVPSVYPARIMGASSRKDGSVSFIYTIGQEVRGATIAKGDLERPKGTYGEAKPIPAPETTLTNNKGNAAATSPDVGEEYEIMTSTRASDRFNSCLGSSSFVTTPPGSTSNDSMLLSFGRGYQLRQNTTAGPYNIGQQFSRYTTYGHNFTDKLEDIASKKLEELKSLRTNRPCDEASAYNHTSKTYGTLSYSDINLFRFASINPLASPELPSLYLYRGSNTNKMNAYISGLIPLGDSLGSVEGVQTKDGAFLGVITINGANALAGLNRKNTTIASFLINEAKTTGGIAHPNPTNIAGLSIPFSGDISDGVGSPKAVAYRNETASVLVVARNTLFLLNAAGSLVEGPTVYSDIYSGPSAGDRPFRYEDESVGWVIYKPQSKTIHVHRFAH